MTTALVPDRAARALSLPKLAALVVAASTLTAFADNALGWFGWIDTGPGDRVTTVEKRVDSTGRAFLDSIRTIRTDLGWAVQLVEASTTKGCLDSEEEPVARRNLAKAGVPCELLYSKRGIRP